MKTKNQRNYLKEKGITLIALVVTIVVLLILAGVSINALFGDNGIIQKAKDAQNKANESTQKDMEQINGLEDWLNEKTESEGEGKITVKFCDYDGTILETVSVKNGETAQYTKGIPTRATEGGYIYSFNKWVTSKDGNVKADLENITSNLSVYANYIKWPTMTENTCAGFMISQVKDANGDDCLSSLKVSTVEDVSEVEDTMCLEEVRNQGIKVFQAVLGASLEDYSIREFLAIKIENVDNKIFNFPLLADITINPYNGQEPEESGFDENSKICYWYQGMWTEVQTDLVNGNQLRLTCNFLPDGVIPVVILDK